MTAHLSGPVAVIRSGMEEPEVALPPMLRPTWREMRPTNPPKVAVEWFSREQMAEYARLAVLADREARG